MISDGRLITLEGLEGVGKSTQVATVVDYLAHNGIQARATREPGGAPFADRIRDLLLSPAHCPPAADTELLLMFAARAEHLANMIEPTIDAGQWVVSDRFTDATYAYQGGGRGIPDERIRVLEQWVQGSRRPHRTLLFDAPVTVALGRVHRRGTTTDRFEAEELAFFERVRAKYLARAAAEPERFRVIDATRSPDEVGESIRNALTDLVTEGT